MKYIITFENFTATIPKAVGIEQEMTLMDKSVDKKFTEEELAELDEEIEKSMDSKKENTKSNTKK